MRRIATRLIYCGALLAIAMAAIPPLWAAIQALTIVLGIQDDISSVSLDDGQGVLTLRRHLAVTQAGADITGDDHCIHSEGCLVPSNPSRRCGKSL